MNSLSRITALAFALSAAELPAQSQSHPSIFLTKQEALDIRAAQGKYPLLDRAIADAKATVAAGMAHSIETPPPGEAGGYAHERHKQNYREMQAAGTLYQITGDAKYARFVRDMLEKYAVLYPTLGPHPLNKNQSAGKLFHQALNEANWLLATDIAYDCVYDALTPAERKRFETNVLRPMAEWLSSMHPEEFDRIHNHGTWATASVGMLGYVIGDTSYVNRALHGTTRDDRGGFLRQLDLLFSPDGYYMEGPYYIRYALMPFFHFADAIQRDQPALRIYAWRDSIFKKAVYAAVQTAYPNGVFAPINDASRTMSIASPEVVVAVDLAIQRYGANPNLLGAAAIQNTVILNGAGLATARAVAAASTPPTMSFGSVEFTDGPDGKRGGLGILRTGTGRDATMLLMKYGVHGQGHGHFDKLHFTLFDGGNEVVPDYGFARWINIEPKYGGRYLPENDSYAMQTIAHNTVTVDQTTQNRANEKADEAVWPERHFFDASNARAQVMSATADKLYPGVAMQRTMFLLRDAQLPHPVVLDLYRIASGVQHTYDYPLHFRGQLIATNAPATAMHTTEQRALGTTYGYEHLWNEGSTRTDSVIRVTWLTGNRYYTVTSAAAPGSEVIFARTGASDSSFNLIVEPMLLVRRQAATTTFASVIEPHGYFNEMEERSADARPAIAGVTVLASTDEGTVVRVDGKGGLVWTVMVTNGAASATARHVITAGGATYAWTGNYSVQGMR